MDHSTNNQTDEDKIVPLHKSEIIRIYLHISFDKILFQKLS